MAADTATAVLPSATEYKEALDSIAAADESLDAVRQSLGRLIDSDQAPSLREGATMPATDEIGRLVIFCAHAELYIDSLRREFSSITERRDALLLDAELEGAT